MEKERILQHAIAKITPFEFEIIMQWFRESVFAVATSGSGPVDYERRVALVHGSDKYYMEGVFRRHCDAIGRLQRSGLLGLDTTPKPSAVQFSYYWTDLGNLVLARFGLIDQAERQLRYEKMPRHLRRVSH